MAWVHLHNRRNSEGSQAAPALLDVGAESWWQNLPERQD